MYKKSLDSTTDKWGEEYFDFNCSICLSKNNACTEAAYYCPECKAYFCKPCMGRCECRHSVMGRGSVDKWGISIHPKLFDRCPKHAENEVQLYCPHHDVVCCTICSHTVHKKCDELKFIPLVVSGQDNKQSETVVKKAVKELKAGIKELREDRSPRLRTVDDSAGNMIQQVRETRAQIDALLNAQEKTSIGDIQKWKNDVTDRIKSELSVCDRIEEDMVELESKIKKSQSNESLLFARLKQGKVVVSDKMDLVSDMLGVNIVDDVQFKIYKDNLKHQKGLGHLVPRDATASQLEKDGTEKGQKEGQMTPKVDSPYKVNCISVANVKMGGEGTSDIWNMCQLSDGHVILADNSNKCLKRLDYTYKVMDRCVLPCEPRGVCQTRPDELAVTLADKTVQYVSVGKQMTLSRSFSTKLDCNGLAYVNGQIFVTQYRGSKVGVYDQSGAELRTFSADQSGKRLFSNTKYITPSPEGNTLIVTDWDKGLIMLETNGKLLNKLGSPDKTIQNACDACVDKAGNVFVCGYNSDNIIQVNHSGDPKLAELAGKDDANICHPQALCFDQVNSCLLVASKCSNAVKVLYVSQEK